LPIPLGCVAARRSLGGERIAAIEAALKSAIEHSLAEPAAAMDYVRQHAREVDEEVLTRHIRMFVNDYSLDLGDDGRAAVAKLRQLARQAGVIK
jgi:1,4-dihydroxy-6-naphthoate synthase